ncbi:MAG: hypothetical protein MR874_03560 [Coriobacteriaceae bacterium]|nr:hypothetical protein [Coriobacteriaceae bacterium]
MGISDERREVAERPLGDELRYGDYVVYDPGRREPEVGRFVSHDAAGSAYVCYHDGCTAARTPGRLLRPATESEAAGASPRIGFHRFDAECPSYDPGCCMGCVHDGPGRAPRPVEVTG